MREILRAVLTGKPIITMLEPEAKHGGMTKEEVLQQLKDADAPCEKRGTLHATKYAMWGLDNEVRTWGYPMANAEQLYAALFTTAVAIVEWNRIGAADCEARALATLVPAAEVQQ